MEALWGLTQEISGGASIPPPTASPLQSIPEIGATRGRVVHASRNGYTMRVGSRWTRQTGVPLAHPRCAEEAKLLESVRVRRFKPLGDVDVGADPLNVRLVRGAGSQEREVGAVLLSGYQRSSDVSSKTHVTCWIGYSFRREDVALAVDWRSAGILGTSTPISSEALIAAAQMVKRVL